jgi:hypothetical protein
VQWSQQNKRFSFWSWEFNEFRRNERGGAVPSKWSELENVSFTMSELGPQMLAAIEKLRNLPGDECLDGVPSKCVFGWAEEILIPAIWDDVENAIIANGGPNIPLEIKPKKGKPVAFHLKSLNWANMHVEQGNMSAEQAAMVRVLSHGVADHLKTIEFILLTLPQDWWIGAALADIRIYVPAEHAVT